MRRLPIQLLALASVLMVTACTNVPVPDPEGALVVTIEPDQDTRVSTDDGSVTIDFPKGAVREPTTATIRVLMADEVPQAPADLGVARVVSAVSVDGLDSTDGFVRISFALPPDLPDPQIAHHHAAGWSLMPSEVDVNGRITADTRTFSIFALVSAPLQNTTYLYQAAGFDPNLYAVHASNDGAAFRHPSIGVYPETGKWYGFCYGMAETAALYYIAGTPTPAALNWDHASGEPLVDTLHSKTFASFVKGRQYFQLASEIPQFILDHLDIGTFSPLLQAEDVFAKMMLGQPLIMGLSNLRVDDGFHHAVLVYRAFKRYDASSDRLEYEFWLYDSNGYGHDGLGYDYYPSRVKVEISNYAAGMLKPWLRTSDVTFDLGYSRDITVFIGYYINPFHTGLPWTNPTIDALGAAVTGTSVRMSAQFSHPSRNASFSQAVWYAESDGGGLDYSGKVPVQGTSGQHVFHDLPAGRYAARAMVQDTQGNWSEAAEVEFTITDATTPPIASRVSLAGLPAGSWTVTMVYPSVLTGTTSFGQVTDGARVAADGSFSLDLAAVTPPPVPLVTANLPAGVVIDPPDIKGAAFSLFLFDDVDGDGLLGSGETIYVLNDPENSFGNGELDLRYVDGDHTIVGSSQTTSGTPIEWRVDASLGWGRMLYGVMAGGTAVEVTYDNGLSGLLLLPGQSGSTSSLSTRSPRIPMLFDVMP